MALTKERNVYTWGSGANGRLGHGNEITYPEPKIVDQLNLNEDIIFIAAGEDNSAAINSRGILYTWGNSKYGKLGLGTEDNVYFPNKLLDQLLSKHRFFYISLGENHTLAIACN